MNRENNDQICKVPVFKIDFVVEFYKSFVPEWDKWHIYKI